MLHNYCRVRNIKFNFALTPSSLLKWQKRQETKRCHCQQRVAVGINQDASSDSLAEGLIARSAAEGSCDFFEWIMHAFKTVIKFNALEVTITFN